MLTLIKNFYSFDSTSNKMSTKQRIFIYIYIRVYVDIHKNSMYTYFFFPSYGEPTENLNFLNFSSL